MYLSMYLSHILPPRNATHSHVVRLLKGSGTRPTLLVSSPPGGRGRRASTASFLTPSVVKEHSTAFKEKVIGESIKPDNGSTVACDLILFVRWSRCCCKMKGRRLSTN